MKPRRTVAVLVESSRGYGRGLLRGISQFARNSARWAILHQEWALDDEAPAWLTRGSCDGVIARIETPELLRWLRRLGVPIVDVRGLHRAQDVPVIDADHVRIARLAADHLLERGFRHIAFCGLDRVDYSVQRRDPFVAYVRQQGIEPLIYEGSAGPADGTTLQKESEAMLFERDLAAWVGELPRPTGVMACNDIRGRQVLVACRAQGIAVPDELAVVGVDNDEVLCELADPPLSSVDPLSERAGHDAAALLEQMMKGRPPALMERRIVPSGVVTRASTDVLALDDRQVALALRFIRERACDGINVEDVLKHLADAGPALAASRSTIDRRFAEVLGRSPKEEIVRVRVERAKQLLIETELTLAEIATRVGIEHAEYLNVLFKAKTGETPGGFRRRMGPAEI